MASKPRCAGEKEALKIWEGCAGMVRRDVERGVDHCDERWTGRVRHGSTRMAGDHVREYEKERSV